MRRKAVDWEGRWKGAKREEEELIVKAGSKREREEGREYLNRVINGRTGRRMRGNTRLPPSLRKE